VSCEECNKAAETGAFSFPVRVGDSDIGYGNALIIACKDHAEYIIDRLQQFEKVERHRDSLARRCAVRFEENEKLREQLQMLTADDS